MPRCKKICLTCSEEFRAMNLGAKYCSNRCHPSKQRANKNNNRAKQYGLTGDDCNRQLLFQNNECPICKINIAETSYIDHCHKTNRIRGLLCPRCNTALGRFKDDIQFLKNSIAYLEAGSIWNGGGLDRTSAVGKA